jgi:branched-chain amino acid transport system permease protein
MKWSGVAVVVLILALLVLPSLADKPGARILQTTITGILAGGVYALVALGIVIINKASGVFNFAHGYMMLAGGFVFYSLFTTTDNLSVPAVGLLALCTVLMVLSTGSMKGPVSLRDALKSLFTDRVALGAYFRALSLRRIAIALVAVIVLTVIMTLPGSGWSQWIRATVGAISAAVLLGLAIERFTIRPLIGQPLFASVLMTLAVAELLRGVLKSLWGSLEVTIPVFATPDPIIAGAYQRLGPIRIDARETFLAGNIVINQGQLIAFVLALVAFAVFIVFFRYTNVGLAMRATAEDQRLAQSVGLRVRVILAVAWAIAALLAMVAGVLQGGANILAPNATPLLALAAFPAVLLGGLDSVPGALVGGIIVGVIQEWANFLFPGTQAGTELAPYVVLMIVLVIRPDGLFGQRRIERI